jgi:hypothetical protein
MLKLKLITAVWMLAGAIATPVMAQEAAKTPLKGVDCLDMEALTKQSAASPLIRVDLTDLELSKGVQILDNDKDLQMIGQPPVSSSVAYGNDSPIGGRITVQNGCASLSFPQVPETMQIVSYTKDSLTLSKPWYGGRATLIYEKIGDHSYSETFQTDKDDSELDDCGNKMGASVTTFTYTWGSDPEPAPMSLDLLALIAQRLSHPVTSCEPVDSARVIKSSDTGGGGGGNGETQSGNGGNGSASNI